MVSALEYLMHHVGEQAPENRSELRYRKHPGQDIKVLSQAARMKP